jgi:hypothetical protein
VHFDKGRLKTAISRIKIDFKHTTKEYTQQKYIADKIQTTTCSLVNDKTGNTQDKALDLWANTLNK